MDVDISEWYAGRPGLVARQYRYSNMGNARDFEMEVHFTIEAGMSIFTFLNFRISDIDLPRETTLRGTLSPINGVGEQAKFTMLAAPSGGGAVMNVPGSHEVSACLKLFMEGKDMHFEVETSNGERLIKLPIPNNLDFRTVFRNAYDQIRAADEAEFRGKDGVMGRLNRFMRGLKGG